MFTFMTLGRRPISCLSPCVLCYWNGETRARINVKRSWNVSHSKLGCGCGIRWSMTRVSPVRIVCVCACVYVCLCFRYRCSYWFVVLAVCCCVLRKVVLVLLRRLYGCCRRLTGQCRYRSSRGRSPRLYFKASRISLKQLLLTSTTREGTVFSCPSRCCSYPPRRAPLAGFHDLSVFC